ncbi:tRNA-uridine aminocarboxypropyltransferase [Amphritea sp. HPY]|uniref:tRNA-uridine aminocarboxypropyltransferase n=1 Tax=Amphritea sp. HPY TaxID=3421652 RepID=UPI003D7D7D71
MQLEKPPRKPFIARGSKIERCENCMLQKQSCICALKSQIQAKAQFCLLSHPYELYKPTNTGRLIVDSIAGTRVFRWHRTDPDPDFIRLINDPAIDPYIVFPAAADYQQRMTSFVDKERRQPLFIILDGTWRQARRIFRLSRYLDHLPVIELNDPGCSSYCLRKAVDEGRLCTVEVAAALLEQIGDARGATHLQCYYEIFNERYRLIRHC